MSKKAKLSEGADGQTVWLKHNVRTYKGETYETFKGSVDIDGKGHMISISLYADLKPVEGSDGTMLIGAYVTKWTGTPKTARTRKTW